MSRYANLETLKWLYDKKIELDNYLENEDNGNLETVKWLYEKNLNNFNFGNDIDVLKYLKSKNYIFSVSMIKNAVKSGKLENIQYIYDALIEKGINANHIQHYFSESEDDNIYSLIEKTGNIEILKWFLSIGILRSEYILESAAYNGHLNMIIYSYEYENFDIDEDIERDIVEEAVRGNHLNIVEWYYNKSNNILTEEIFETALNCGHVNILDWLVTKKCPRNETISYSKFLTRELIEKYCPKYSFSNNFASYAASDSSFDLVKWALSKGCPYDETIIIFPAFHKDSFEFIKWALTEFKIPWNESVFSEAAFGKNIQLIKWLHENYPSRGNGYITYRASIRGNFYNLKFLHSKGYTFDESAIEAACIYKHYHVLKWLCKIGAPYDKNKLLKMKNNFYYSFVPYDHPYASKIFTEWVIKNM